jgi:hypothetical protein
MSCSAARKAAETSGSPTESIGGQSRVFTRPAPIQSIGFLARGARRDICVEAVIELSALNGRLPSCIDLLDSASHPMVHCDVDLILLSRSPSDPMREPQQRAGDAILLSGAPVLLLPQRPSGHRLAGERALIIWDGSLSAISAVRGAALLLQQASEIVLVNAIEGEARASLDSALDFLNSLPGQRLIDETRLHLETKPLILETALLTGADYLVMGGFGRWNALPDLVYGDSDSPFPRSRVPLLLGQ